MENPPNGARLMKTPLRLALVLLLYQGQAVCHAEAPPQTGYARGILDRAGHDGVTLKVVEGLGHREAFRVVRDSDRQRVEAASPAGLIYGAQALVRGEATPGAVEKPDFDIRGTTLPMFKGGGYVATLSPKTFPWFYDRQFMTRTLDAFAEARLNTIFLWGSHLFPYIVQMPEYPEAAADVSPEQVKANYEQFLWFTTECERRNIQVLLHFYNIHVSPPFAKKHGIRTNPTAPTPLLKEYTRYALSRYFEEFPSVGLYACPGESLHSSKQLEWFRDVIFDAAKKSGKKPIIVIRDWTLNHDFSDQLKALYDNCYSELKHNDESMTSPCPDLRHMKWEGLTAGHIINAAHGPATDLQPMRWASPLFIQESAQHWKSLGFVKGVEFWGISFWRWPYTFDKVVDSGGPRRLLYLDRDGPYYAAVGRYLWDCDRDPQAEQAFWTSYYAQRYGSKKIGELIARWYVVTGPISPGIQNVNATKVANFWSSVLLMNQNLDQILTYNKSLDETPYTLHRETGRAGQRYYPRPFDAYFFKRYREKHGVPTPGKTIAMFKEFGPYKKRLGVKDLEQRKCMPVTQYAGYLQQGKEVQAVMTPDKVCRLLNDLAKESLTLAEEAEAAAEDPAVKAQIHRFVTDSKMYVLATEALCHKEQAAILKACMLLTHTCETEQADAFIEHMEASVRVYEKLAALTGGTYLYAHGYRGLHWNRQGIAEFKADLATQRAWLARFNKQRLVLPPGSVRIEAENMEGPWRKGSDRYGDFLGQGYAASWYAAKDGEPLPIKSQVRIPAERQYTVWVRALVGGAHQDRALAVEIAGRRQPSTHAGKGPESGAFVWQKAGAVKLPLGAVDVLLHPVGKRHATADAILLVPSAEWKPER